MAVIDLTFSGITTSPGTGHADEPRHARLHLITPAGVIRHVELREDDLIRIIYQASKCLAIVRGVYV